MNGRDTESSHSAEAEADALAEYRRKRDFERTSEPLGGDPDARRAETPETDAALPERGAPDRGAASRDALTETVSASALPRRIFVIQKHDASRLHYDLRLEVEGVLKSWAVPKGPSLDPAERRLAVMVEDHPLEYAMFEGTIPEGEYGGGTVMLWDAGWWEPDEAWMREAKGHQVLSPEEALAKGDLKFVLHGEKLSGSWALVQMKGRGDKNWLLIKHRDGSARPGSDIEAEEPDSVASGRSLEQIAADAAAADETEIPGAADPAAIAGAASAAIAGAGAGAGG